MSGPMNSHEETPSRPESRERRPYSRQERLKIVDGMLCIVLLLVDRVVEPGEVMAAAEALLREILAQGPLAVRHVIELVDAGLETGVDDALTLEATAFGLLATTEDAAEGMAAFVEKRPADFRGR